MIGRSYLTGEPIYREPCEGEGEAASDDTRYGNTICPVCRGIAPVDDHDRVAAHEVRVI